MGVRPRWRPRIPRRAQGGAAEGGHYAGCKSAAYLSQSAIPLDRPTLIGPNRRKLTLCDPTQLLFNHNHFSNHYTIAFQPRTNHREPQPHPQPSLNRHATASQPRTNHNHPSCRIQERFRLNHPTSVSLRIQQHRAAWPWLVHQLPWPSRRFLHHPRREGDRQAVGNGAISAVGE